ncbi:MAG: hydroxylamine reductase [Bacteroidales bacterium]|nr:hydroxylamine reductase [Bacteroidales bacterium]
MSTMFCYQCQETAKGTGCVTRGVCGKTDDVANIQDLLIFVLKGLSVIHNKARANNLANRMADRFVTESLFTTITNANFDFDVFTKRIFKGIELRKELETKLKEAGIELNPATLHESATWEAKTVEEMVAKAPHVGILATKDEDIRSLRELIIYGLKGMAAYAEHSMVLGYEDDEIYSFMQKALEITLDDSLSPEDLVTWVLETGNYGVKVMALLDKANTSTYGHPEMTKVNIGVGNKPGILISGHDLKDMEELLQQTEGTGVDVYTHSEMLPANYYPAFKKYKHFIGNYGNAWWKQREEFETFNGPVLFTTNCIVPPFAKAKYKDKVFTTGSSGFPGFKHIPDRVNGNPKDFSEIIELAKTCQPPTAIEEGEIIGGFAHNQVFAVADKVVEAVKSGAIRKFIVMAGCDGRNKSREYYTEFAQKLPKDTVILTAGCAKYRYNKLPLGDINGIPRVLDAGQCNDSYSLVVIALKLKEIFGLNDVNELPLAFNIAWYEQKAIIVILALLSLGVKNIQRGPTVSGFFSPAVKELLGDRFNISTIGDVNEDIKLLAY